MIDVAAAQGDLADVYAEIGAKSGNIANILLAQSFDAEALRLHYRQLMFGPSPLSRTLRESIAVTVSLENHCH